MRFANEYLRALYATRKVNLHRLVDGYGSQQAVCEAMGVDRAYMSRLATGKTPITECIARNIEEVFHMRFGALDREN